MRIALVEDDAAQADLLASWLKDAGHDCHAFADAAGFLRTVARESFDLTILDWGLPDLDGDEVVSRLRRTLDWPMPVLFVTSRDAEQDIVRALELGADDYLAKPPRRAETLARVSALLRRAAPEVREDGKFTFAPYEFDSPTHSVAINGEAITLTHREYELALFMFRNAGRLLSRGHLMETVWGTKPDLNTRTIDTHMSRVRAKLKLMPANGWRLNSIYQHGYRLERLDGT